MLILLRETISQIVVSLLRLTIMSHYDTLRESDAMNLFIVIEDYPCSGVPRTDVRRRPDPCRYHGDGLKERAQRTSRH